MPGQLAAYGAQTMVNYLANLIPPALVNGISANPPTWVPGLIAIDYSVNPPETYYWNTQTWVAGPLKLYLALLTGDPSQSGPGNGFAVGISDLIEDQTPGYARQEIFFTQPGDPGYPDQVTNTNLITYGPYTAAQQNPAQWAALVTAETGDLGLLLYTWSLPSPYETAAISQTINVPAGYVSLTQT